MTNLLKNGFYATPLDRGGDTELYYHKDGKWWIWDEGRIEWEECDHEGDRPDEASDWWKEMDYSDHIFPGLYSMW